MAYDKQKETERIYTLLGVSVEQYGAINDLPPKERRKAIEPGSIYVMERRWYNEATRTYKTSHRPVLVVSTYKDNDIQIFYINQKHKSATNENITQSRHPYVQHYVKTNLPDTGLLYDSWVDTGKFDIIHSEELKLPRIGNIKENYPEKFHELLVLTRESLMNTTSQHEVLESAKYIKREIDLLKKRITELENDLKTIFTKPPTPQQTFPPSKEKSQETLSPQSYRPPEQNIKNINPGNIYKISYPYYDIRYRAHRRKQRPALVLGKYDDGTVLVTVLTRTKVDEKTGKIKYFTPDRQPFCHEISQNKNPNIGLQNESWLDAGKFRIVSIRDIEPTPIGNIKDAYPETYHKILLNMKESAMETLTKDEIIANEKLINHEVGILKNRIQKLTITLTSIEAQENQKKEIAKNANTKNKYASLKKPKKEADTQININRADELKH